MILDAATVDLIRQTINAGPAVLLAVALVGLMRGWVYPAWYVDELRDRLDDSLTLSERNLLIAGRSLDVAERHSERGKR